ncbi:MAG: DNA polymerase III subunit gamma/tau [Pseudomonadota bacterium]
MSYLVLARKYRPSGFSTVSGQEHVTRTLANAIARGKVVHAYLFTGPRGVGKTSVARILARALNCQAIGDSASGSTFKNAEPCQECSACREIASGTSMAVREIDGASHNSVDNVRDLMDSFKALPPPGYRNKVYIIDEVHMLSISAFNALLKSLEEPPPNTVFILATTEVHKIPETVISRCQRHDFRALSVSVIEARLAEVCRQEKLEAEGEALTMIARLADGSMRDAQTLLDRVQTFCAGTITAAETSKALGSFERSALARLAHTIIQRDVEQVLAEVAELFSTGGDPATLLKEFTHFWRELFIAKVGGEARLKTLGLGADSVVELMRLVTPLETVDLQDLWDLAREGADRCMRSSYPRYGFEALVVRMATRQPIREIGALIGQLSVGQSPSVNVARSSAPRASTQAVVVPKSATTLEASQKPLAAAAGALQWEQFLRFVGERGSKILLENLKRLSATRFEVGLLEATGPEFTTTSLTRDKAKLQEMFSAFVGEDKAAAQWKVTLKKGAAEAEVADPRKANESKIEELETHPALQSLQRVFPGSKVEQVRVKGD